MQYYIVSVCWKSSSVTVTTFTVTLKKINPPWKILSTVIWMQLRIFGSSEEQLSQLKEGFTSYHRAAGAVSHSIWTGSAGKASGVDRVSHHSAVLGQQPLLMSSVSVWDPARKLSLWVSLHQHSTRPGTDLAQESPG